MPPLVRIISGMPLLVAISLLAGCQSASWDHLRHSQIRARQLYSQNKELMVQRDQSQAMAQSLANERDQLAQRLELSEQRLANSANESQELRQRYVSLLDQAKDQSNPLSDATTQRFKELASKYPGFEFDPQTGVSKFHSDILFASGSDTIQTKGQSLLQKFAEIMNSGDAAQLNILIVGHTDDQRIAKSATRQKHPTNWHLSTNRANSVAMVLSKSGLKENRMGVAGYSMHQPVASNKETKGRAMNRRVEIFVLAPDASVAGWDPMDSLN